MTAPIGSSKRIAKNTVMLYIRMIFLMLISLYTSRVILQVLGVTDFGIYNAVGGFVSILAFINGSMSIAVQRYLAYDWGRGDLQSLNRVFNMALIIHGLIAVVVAVLVESIGYYFLTHYMKFPAERYDAAVWVFHFSVFACCIRFLQVPYNALLVSFERMDAFAYLSIIEGILNLAIVYLLQIGAIDKLKLYAVLTAGVAVLVVGMYALYCRLKVKEIKLKLQWDNRLFRQLLSFASWSALVEISWAATGQGVNVLLNIFFGPVVNAARGIAYQVLGAVNRFVMGFQTAVNPQIIKRYAAGELHSMQNLLIRGTCYSYYLLLFLSLPLFLRMDFILNLWLGQEPPHLVMFCRLVLLGALTDILSNLIPTVAKAYGNIRNYQIIVSVVLMLNLPLSYLVLKLGAPAESVFVVYILISISLFVVRLLLITRMVKLQVKAYLKQVLFPAIFVSALSVPIPLFAHLNVENNFGGFVVVSILSCICVLIAIYTIGLTQLERNIVRKKFQSYIKRNGIR